METIGERIKVMRKRKGLTQADMKSLAGISSGNLSDIENNKSLPSSSALISLSRELEVSIDWILTGEERSYIKHTTSQSTQETVPPQGIELLSKFYQLTKEEQLKIEGMIDGLLLGRELNSAPRNKSTHSKTINEGDHAAASETA